MMFMALDFSFSKIAYYFMAILLIMFIIALFQSMTESDDEKLRKFIKAQIKELFNKRLEIVSADRGKKIFWRDHEGRFKLLGFSNNYGVSGSGEYMIFFKKSSTFLKIFPNIFANHIGIRTEIDAVSRLGDDSIIVDCLGFQPYDNYWYSLTKTMDTDVINKLTKKDRDILLGDVWRTEIVRTAITKVDSSIMSRISGEDLKDMEGSMYGGIEKKESKIEM